MSPPPPPPPPPHGDNPKTTSSGPNLPKGKYDIFIIPEHSAGSGFLYLPSLQPNINSFVAGFASALACVVVFQSMAPALKSWWTNFQGMGNMGMFLLMVAIGMGAWSLGRQQGDTPGGPGQGRGSPGGGGYSSTSGGESFGSTGGTYSSPPPNAGPPPHQQAPPPPQPENPRADRPKSSWQQPPPQPGTARTETPKNTWEKAREETRKREEERKAKEAEQKRKDDAARRLREMREREAREREQREKESRERAAKDKEKTQAETRERELRDKELRERLERETRERVERETRERLEREAREKVQREMREREERERKVKEEAERLRKEEESKARKGSTYAYSSVGEKTSMWPNGRPPAASSHPASPAAAGKAASATTPTTTAAKKQPAPTARSTAENDADAYSFRPYDKPRKPAHKKSVSDFSEASWTPSQSTARTSPPPSMRVPYSTKDPDKIVIRAVYGFVNQFAKTPASQLISGIGTVTDGLILRITTEGLFIDDDVRGVAQREWDVKAWTLKLVEVWCPTHTLASAAAAASNNPAAATPTNHPFFKTMPGARRAADRGGPKTLVGDDADAYLIELLRACKDCCRLGLCSSSSSRAPTSSSASETTSSNSSHHNKSGDWKAKGLHLLRATIRDQEGKRYLFVLSEEESWKVAVGLQRLRRGTQVRALGVAGFSGLEARNMLETLGW